MLVGEYTGTINGSAYKITVHAIGKGALFAALRIDGELRPGANWSLEEELLTSGCIDYTRQHLKAGAVSVKGQIK